MELKPSLCFLIEAKKEISIGKIFKFWEFEECFEVQRMGSKWWTNFGLENRVTGKHSRKKQQSNSYEDLSYSSVYGHLEVSKREEVWQL